MCSFASDKGDWDQKHGGESMPFFLTHFFLIQIISHTHCFYLSIEFKTHANIYLNSQGTGMENYTEPFQPANWFCNAHCLFLKLRLGGESITPLNEKLVHNVHWALKGYDAHVIFFQEEVTYIQLIQELLYPWVGCGCWTYMAHDKF